MMVFISGWAAGRPDPADIFNFLILDGNGAMRYDNPVVNNLLEAANLLQQASALLNRSVNSNQAQTISSRAQQNGSLSTVSDSVTRTRRMLEQSSSRGTFRRLNNSERIRVGLKLGRI